MRQVLRRWWSIRKRKDVLLSLPPIGGRRFYLHNLNFVARYLLKMSKHWRRRITVPIIEGTLRRMFPEACVVGDKYPDYLFSLDSLVKRHGLFCLVLYRDCRDVTNSTLEKARTVWHGRPFAEQMNTAEKVATRWVHGIEIMERHADKLHIIGYEDLVQQPEQVFGALGKWLGVDAAGFPTHIIRDTSIGKHKHGLTGKEQETVMKIAGPTMARLGYL
jgi:hypothetical protein